MKGKSACNSDFQPLFTKNVEKFLKEIQWKLLPILPIYGNMCSH